jgi:hypothetical protein
MNDNDKLVTFCEHCCFAEWEDGVQEGCKLGRLKMYQDAGLVEQKDYFYLINTICGACRSKEWMLEIEEKGLDPTEIVKDEMTVKLDYIIFSHEDPLNKVTQKVFRTIKSIMDLKPKSIIVCIKNESVKYFQLNKELDNLINSRCPYQLMSVKDVDAGVPQMLDMACKKCKAPYYITLKAGNVLPNGFIDRFNELMSGGTELRRILMVTNPECNFNRFIASTLLHKYLIGNDPAPLYDKVKYLAKEQNKEDMIVCLE